LSYLPWADNLNLRVYDFFLSNTQLNSTHDNIVVIGIDDETLQHFEDPLVLWHEYLSQVIRGVTDGEAQVIGLDIIPTISLEKIAPEYDRKLMHAMKQSSDNGTPVYLGFKAGKSGLMPHKKFLFVASGLGFLNLSPDNDGKIRQQVLTMTGEDNAVAYAFPLLLAKTNMQLTSKELPQELFIDYRLGIPRILSFSQVYDWMQDGDLNRLKLSFKDKIVFIGMTSARLPDVYSVPIVFNSGGSNRMSGVLIQAMTTKTLLKGEFFQSLSSQLVLSLTIILGLISGIIFLLLSPRKASIIIIVLFFIGAFATYGAFTLFVVIPVAPLMFGMFIPGAVTGIYRYATEYRQFRRLQRFFKSYVSQDVMQEIIEKPGAVSFEGRHVVATVMFTDIRNFTSLSEKMNPEAVVTGLNIYFTEMTKAVIESGGYLNRYLGDGILAIFGAPNKLPDNGAWPAVVCGMNMLKRLEELNKNEVFPGFSENMSIGIGVHTGEAVVGNIGCYEKMDYSIVGDTVNLASRIENETKKYQKSFLISETTYELIKNRVDARFVTTALVSGRLQEVKLYEVLSIKEEE
jgi:adenylate cyclase